MRKGFFSRFPKITYANTVTTDITRRVSLTDTVFADPYVFYPYDVNQGERPDNVANAYYGDPYMDWLVFLSNGFVDPYHQWYLTDAEFHPYLLKKYDVPNIETLEERVAFYRCNWYDMDDISVSEYEALVESVPAVIKYWEPVYGNSTRPIHYTRKREDWMVTTNGVVRYRTSTNSGFAANEKIQVAFHDANNSLGEAQVIVANSTYVTVQHLEGNTVPVTDGEINSSSRLVSLTDGTSIRFTSGTLLARNVPLEEAVYWSPVSVYDVERERNEQNKSIVLLDASYTSRAVSDLKEALSYKGP